MKTLGKIMAVLSCIIYFFLMASFMTLAFATNLVSGDYYANVFKNLNFKDIKMSDLGELKDEFNFDELEDELELSDDTTLEDVLIYGLKTGGVEETTARAIVENDEIREIVGNFIGEYINYNLGGDLPTISRKEVEAVFNNKDVIEAVGRRATDEEIDTVYDNLLEMIEDIKEGKRNNGGNEEVVVKNRW